MYLHSQRRRGLTLIELLVVVAIIIAISAMIVAAAPRFGERQNPSRGASMLQSWLNLSRSMALRDQRPRGIRLPAVTNAASNAATYVREVFYIEQPEDFTGGQVVMPDPTHQSDPPPPIATPDAGTRYRYVRLINVNVPGVNAASVQASSLEPTPIKIGDVILIDQFPDQPRRIVNITQPSSDPNQTTLQLDKELIQATDVGSGVLRYPDPPAPSENYRIFRSARPMPGEPPLQLPRDVGIDISRGPNLPNPNASTPEWHRLFPKTGNTGGPNPLDILFAPSGQAVGPFAASTSRIVLWVRDVSTDVTDPTVLPPGDNTLITVYTHTGLVTAHPIDPTGLVPNTAGNPNSWNPFRFTHDSQASQ